jgi:hypothetical protein
VDVYTIAKVNDRNNTLYELENTMTTAEITTKTELKKLDNRRAELIRKLYCEVACALPQLAEELEFADLDLGGEGGPLIEEHLVVCEMMEAFRRVTVGKFL